MPSRVSRFVAGLALAAAAGSGIAACNPLVLPARGITHPKPHPWPTFSPRPIVSPTPTAAPTTDPTSPPTAGPTTPTPTSAPTSDAAAYESRILMLVNAERAKLNESALTLVSCADTFANSWATTMAQTGTFAHQSLSPIMQACSANAAGENIAYGNVTADQMMTMWMNSPGHRANILNPGYTGIGIGAVQTSGGRWYGVQDFVTQ